MDLLSNLESSILPADGAMGTLLLESGAAPDSCLEELCVSSPDTILAVHEQYITAGARLIRTNTFGANSVRLEKHRLHARVNEINWTAAQLAKQAARGKNVFVAGSVGPLALSAAETAQRGIDRRAIFQEQIGALLDGGVNLIQLETFNDLDELLIAVEVKHSLHHCPVICSLACSPEGRLPSGIPVTEAFATLRDSGADILGLNCVNGPDTLLKIVQSLSPSETPLAAFPNAGLPRTDSGRPVYDLTPADFTQAALSLVEAGVRLIGGCCGIHPPHIAALAAALAAGLPPK